MTWSEIELVEWTCDFCSAHVLGDEALPEGWTEVIGTGDHWCGCARTLAVLEAGETVVPVHLVVWDAPTLAEGLGL